MTRERLSHIGQLLYGPRWRDPLSDELRIAERTVRRWIAGSIPIPDSIKRDLARLCRERASELNAVAKELEENR